MTRLDRTRTSPHQLRPFFSSQNLLNRADGSAQFDFGEFAGDHGLAFFLDIGPMTGAEPARKAAADGDKDALRPCFST